LTEQRTQDDLLLAVVLGDYNIQSKKIVIMHPTHFMQVEGEDD
jgi:hypothetical protein